MGTPASLLDIIARGGSMVGANEAAQSQANTNLTNLQAQNVPIEGQLKQAQVGQVQGQTEAQRIANVAAQRQADAQQAIQEYYASLAQQGQSAPSTAQQGPPVPLPGGAMPPQGSQPPPQGAPPLPPGVSGTPLSGDFAVPPAQAQPRPNPYLDPLGATSALARDPRMTGGALQSFLTHNIETSKAIQGLTKEQRDNELAINEVAGSRLQNIAALPVEARGPAYQAAIPTLQKADPTTDWSKIDPTNNTQLQALIGGLVSHKGLVEQANTLAEQKSREASAGASTATAAKTAEETKKLAFENSLLKGIQDPAAMGRMAEDIAPAAQYPDINRQLVADMSHAQSLDEMKAIREKASNQVLAQSPGAMKAHANEAKLTAEATAPIEEKKAALLQQSAHAFSQVDTVTGKYAASLADQRTAVATAKTIQDVLDLSNKGSAIASNQLKAIVPRFTAAIDDMKVRGAETGDAGLTTTAQHLSSEVSSLMGGNPLSERTRTEIAPYIQTIAAGSTSKHNALVSSLKTAYPGQSKSLDFEAPPGERKIVAEGPNKQRLVSVDSGRTWLDQGTGKPVDLVTVK